ncbi:cysteine-rich DPF motif domain-containing protein 1 [Hypomesus transpacificus]|uniref:cysteine-rich DPF motif domain-containing protein 1 n=1 Tax=Hypomesus transpacificus TaxID=137520 RepID=UPI001F08720B|nr:cysteine-rich DPF motif domain-containing protein 1 [Hypomesus transpacificus]
MESNTDVLQTQFTCRLCGLSTPFTYYGQKPPNTRSIILLEECYVTKDPFSPDRERFLVLGSHCSSCNSPVCVGSDCSLFYTRRFCLACVSQNQSQLPPQIQVELSKKKSRSTIPQTALS